MQLTILVKNINKKNNFKKHKLIWGSLIACYVLALSNFAEGAPKFYSKIDGGTVHAVYNHDKHFAFSAEENKKIVKGILEKLPLASSATFVASSKPTESVVIKDTTLGYTQTDRKTVHMVAVNFARTDLLPLMYFQVKEDWKDCDHESDYCTESVSYEISGPSKLVRDLQDFGSFPTSLNIMKVAVSLENQTSSVNANAPLALIKWDFTFREIDNGIEDYMRYFRSKAGNLEQRVTLKNVRGAMALWASQVSQQAIASETTNL